MDLEKKRKSLIIILIIGGCIVVFGIIAIFGMLYGKKAQEDLSFYDDFGDDELIFNDTLSEAYSYSDLLSITNSCIREPDLKMQDIGYYQNMAVLIYVVEGTILDEKVFYVVNLDFVNEFCNVQRVAGTYASIADVPVDLSENNQSLSGGRKVMLGDVPTQDMDVIGFYLDQKFGAAPLLDDYGVSYLEDGSVIFTATDEDGKKYTIKAKTVLDYTIEVN